MPEPRPILKKVRGGYRVEWGRFTAKIRLAARGPVLPINAEVFIEREGLASLFGTRTGETAHLQDLRPSKSVSQAQGLRACGVLLQSVEIALRKAGVEAVRGRTHPGFARFMQQMGYTVVDKGTTRWDMGKDIKRRCPRLPFRIKPRPAKRKARKRPAPRLRRRPS